MSWRIAHDVDGDDRGRDRPEEGGGGLAEAPGLEAGGGASQREQPGGEELPAVGDERADHEDEGRADGDGGRGRRCRPPRAPRHTAGPRERRRSPDQRAGSPSPGAARGLARREARDAAGRSYRGVKAATEEGMAADSPVVGGRGRVVAGASATGGRCSPGACGRARQGRSRQEGAAGCARGVPGPAVVIGDGGAASAAGPAAGRLLALLVDASPPCARPVALPRRPIVSHARLRGSTRSWVCSRRQGAPRHAISSRCHTMPTSARGSWTRSSAAALSIRACSGGVVRWATIVRGPSWTDTVAGGAGRGLAAGASRARHRASPVPRGRPRTCGGRHDEHEATLRHVMAASAGQGGPVCRAAARLLYCRRRGRRGLTRVPRARRGRRVDPPGGLLVSLRASFERVRTCANSSRSLARSASVATTTRTRTRRTTRTASSSRSTVAGAGRTLCTRRRAKRAHVSWCPLGL